MGHMAELRRWCAGVSADDRRELQKLAHPPVMLLEIAGGTVVQQHIPISEFDRLLPIAGDSRADLLGLCTRERLEKEPEE